jgi:ATP-dependent helicase HrpB
VPSGARVRIDYSDPERPVLAVRIQELFGLAETPRLAGGRTPLLLHLLAPNGRPQQVTDDLASFWRNTYPQVRRELAGRYPKHAWPENPATATPGRRPRQRRG